MANEKNVTMPTKVVGGLARFSYANVFKPKLNDLNNKTQYSVVLLIPKKDKALVEKIKAGIKAATQLGLTKCWNNVLPPKSKFKNPLRDGDEEKPEDEVYKGMYFISAKSDNRPGVVDADLNPVMDESDFYSGCYGNFSINFYPFAQKGNVGVGAGLLNLQKVKDGEKLSGGSTPEEDFGKAEISTDDDDTDLDDIL